jgi:hypothetical protein
VSGFDGSWALLPHVAGDARCVELLRADVAAWRKTALEYQARSEQAHAAGKQEGIEAAARVEARCKALEAERDTCADDARRYQERLQRSVDGNVTLTRLLRRVAELEEVLRRAAVDFVGPEQLVLLRQECARVAHEKSGDVNVGHEVGRIDLLPFVKPLATSQAPRKDGRINASNLEAHVEQCREALLLAFDDLRQSPKFIGYPDTYTGVKIQQALAASQAPRKEMIDPRPKCIKCGRRWVPCEGVDATTEACGVCIGTVTHVCPECGRAKREDLNRTCECGFAGAAVKYQAPRKEG